ncbi:unnamed protein product [Caenorhabditis auriculariae]|uniref:DUF19 domain-containing protein n=1 Tax=Caenorhabditis auriculariae TaxID=2777116 RepID=A0A8S1H8Y7_9PELO|nr:unnamed protein product [Caenorhabditis auriculariae]
MLRYLIAVAIFALGVSAQQTRPPPHNCTAAESAQEKQCFQQYYNNFGPPNPFTFMNWALAYQGRINATGRVAFDQNCLWQQTLDQCSRGGNTRRCLTNDNFAQWFGVSGNDSISFRTEFYISQYECGPGKRVMDQNFDCINKVWIYENNDINSCINTFNANIAKGQDPCKAYNQYITCIDNIYNIICGPAVRGLVCQIEEITLEVNTHQCDRVLQHCNNRN